MGIHTHMQSHSHSRAQTRRHAHTQFTFLFFICFIHHTCILSNQDILSSPLSVFLYLLGSCRQLPPRPTEVRRLLLGDFTAKHLQHQWSELHAVLRLKGQWAVLFGVLLVKTSQVSQLLDHLGVEQPPSRVVKPDVGLQSLRQSVLQGFDPCMILHTWAVCNEGGGKRLSGLMLGNRK